MARATRLQALHPPTGKAGGTLFKALPKPSTSFAANLLLED